MRKIDCGLAGTRGPVPCFDWSELELRAPWTQVGALLAGGRPPRPVQAKALSDLRLLESRRNMIVSAPTNSGKSLVGTLALMDAARRGRRALLLEPLRAIAREKADEFQDLSAALAAAFGRPLRVTVTTGDYRLDDESMVAPPPRDGELVIATPERFEAILRNPRYEPWVQNIGAVCVDEAHLISSAHRGPTLEYVVTSLLSANAPPRIVMLSASVGDAQRAKAWLEPCDVLAVGDRSPALRREVWETDGEEDHRAATEQFVRAALAAPDGAALIFVYQTRAAEALARSLGSALGEDAGPDGPLAYHAQMPAAARERVRRLFQAGQSRVVVTTTALALGVNLPATHVLVRDSYFPGVGPVPAEDLLQMLGRAGRGNREGHGVVLVPAKSSRSAAEVAAAIKEERLPELRSSFDVPQRRRTRSERPSEAGEQVRHAAGLVASLIARHGKEGLSFLQVERFLSRSLGGAQLAARVPAGAEWLTDPSRLLAHAEDGRLRLTRLGAGAVQAALPLPLAAGLGQLMRDLLAVSEDDALLRKWKPLDTLLIAELTTERPRALRPFSSALADQVDAWMEGHSAEVPVLYRNWIVGREGFSKAEEVFGSLGVEVGGAEEARRAGYLATLRAIVLTERSRGRAIAEVERRWGVANLGGIEERWRDDLLWFLSGIASVVDVRCFLYHLRTECRASDERVRRVTRLLRGIRIAILQLRERLKYCSPLGALWVDLRRRETGTANGRASCLGAASLRRLENAGVTSVEMLGSMTQEELKNLGVPRRAAEALVGHFRRRAS